MNLSYEEYIRALEPHHENCFRALQLLRDVCNQNKIQYFLLAGSTLGAVRHGGFIPWDDDIDVGIFVKDYPAFEEAIRSVLPDGYTWTGLPESRSDYYPRLFGKLLFQGKCCVDVFMLAKWTNNRFIGEFLWKVRSVNSAIVIYHACKENKCNLSPEMFALIKLMSAFISYNFAVRVLRGIQNLFEKKTTQNYVNLYSIYSMKKEMLKAEWLMSPATVDFNGEQFTTVGETDAYLRKLYGDYSVLPDIETRFSNHTEIFN